MPNKPKKVKKTSSTIPDSKKHQPKLVLALTMMLAVMVFVAATAIGCFLVSQSKLRDARQNPNAILYSTSSEQKDEATFTIYMNGLIVREVASRGETQRSILRDEEVDDLENLIETIDPKIISKTTDEQNRARFIARVFSTRLKRWINLAEHDGYDVIRNESAAAEDLEVLLTQIISRYFRE